jgi:hypothetical protein
MIRKCPPPYGSTSRKGEGIFGQQEKRLAVIEKTQNYQYLAKCAYQLMVGMGDGGVHGCVRVELVYFAGMSLTKLSLGRNSLEKSPIIIILQYVFTSTAGKIATAMAHQG